MKEQDVVLNFTLVLFSISFSWMVAERINSFPMIRRFSVLWRALKPSNWKDSDFRYCVLVFLSAWITIPLFLAVSIYLLTLYAASLSRSEGYSYISHVLFVPFLFFLAPQFVSRAITSFVFALGAEKVETIYTSDPRQFEAFSEMWKEKFGLEPFDKKAVALNGCRRTFGSFVYLIAILSSIFMIVL